MYHVATLTSSDKAYAGERDDRSGPLLREILEKNDYQIFSQTILPDDRRMLSEKMKSLADSGDVELILTTGGTGLSPRDLTPEASLDIADRLVPGISEAIRAYSLTITKRAMLSRAVCVIRGQCLIINLPGSPKAVQESLEYLLPVLPHALGILTGKDSECGS